MDAGWAAESDPDAAIGRVQLEVEAEKRTAVALVVDPPRDVEPEVCVEPEGIAIGILTSLASLGAEQPLQQLEVRGPLGCGDSPRHASQGSR